MRYVFSAIAFGLIAFHGFCGEGMPITFYSHWKTLTNTANFHETHSTTNISPEPLQYILRVLGSMGVQAEHRSKMAEPREPLINGSRLVWAATDNTNWIIHYEFVFRPDPGHAWTNFCIAAALPAAKAATLKCCNGGYMRRFKDYKEFITYESQRRVRF